MRFLDLFKDDNEINEKSIIGFIAFAVMIICMALDLITGYIGKDLVINDFVYNSFVVTTLGCFGISGVEKIASKKSSAKKSDDEDEFDPYAD